MLIIRTNINSRTHYNEDGSQFVAGMPKMFFRSRDTIAWQLYSDTPGLDEGETPDDIWTKFTGYGNVTGINAYLTADSNYTHRIKGKLLSDASGTITTITAQIAGAGFNTIPEAGTVNLFDNEGQYETVQYNRRTIEDSTVTFYLGSSVQLDRSYSVDGVMDAGEEVYMQATLDYQRSDVAHGLFVFNITAYSEKLRQAIVYSDVESVPIRGLELAIFQVHDGYKQDIERYVVTTFKIMSGIAETGLDPVLPEEHRNEAALMVETLLASGFAVQYSIDGSAWVDEAEEGVPYAYFRFRSAGVGGTWSSPIYLRQGERGVCITNGTAITGRSTEPTAYETGLDDSLVGDMYINKDTQDVYVCIYEGDESTALWVYEYCLKGEAFDKLDLETINQNSDSELQAIGFKETNASDTVHVWIGTRQQYDEQHKDDDDDLCIITDEEEALLVDSELSTTSPNLVQNRTITNAIIKKQDIAKEVITSTATLLTVEPDKAYKWSLSSNGSIGFDHTSYTGKRVVIPVKLTLANDATVTGSTTSSTAVTIEGTIATGDWEIVWDGAAAVFRRVGIGVADESDSLVIDTDISNSSTNPVENRAIAAALALKADKSQLPTIDSELSDSSTNPVQNKVVKAALDKKLDIELPVTSSTTTSLSVEKGKAYMWTPSGNATIAFDHTGLSDKRVSIPVYLTLSSGRTITGSTASSTAVTINGTVETGECELLWNGSTAYFQRKGADGAAGTSSYLYIAYATNSSGSGFTLTPDSSHPYMAVKVSQTQIDSPTASDFTGSTWMKYLGADGDKAFVYIAYATNSSGSGWTLTPDASHPYMAVKQSNTALTPTSSDFTGATWVKYIGDSGARGSRINWGTAITGTSTTPTAYATGISDSLANDIYVNTDTEYVYQCTTGGDASAALWIYKGSLKGDGASFKIQLNGVQIADESDSLVDVQALPLVSSYVDVSDSSFEQDHFVYAGEDSGSLLKGHTYERGTTYNDNIITVTWDSNTHTLRKHGSKWDDGDGSSYDWSMYYSSGNWVLSGSGPTYTSPSADAASNPWDFSGQAWTFNLGGSYVLTITRAIISRYWKDISPSQECLPISETTPTSESLFLYTGDESNSESFVKGHTYERETIYYDTSIQVKAGQSGTNHTLTKQSSTSWRGGDGDWTLSYNTAAGRWAYYDYSLMSYNYYFFSPVCDSSVPPWTFSGQVWDEYVSNGPNSYDYESEGYEIIFNVPSSSSWKDISPKCSLVTREITDDMDYAIYAGDESNSESFVKGHLYENLFDDSVVHLSFTVNGSTVSLNLTKLSEGYWNYTSGYTTYSLSYDSIEHAWYFNYGSNSAWYSPSVGSSVMPWDSSVSGQLWDEVGSEYGDVRIYIDDPRSWSDITPVGEVQLNGKSQTPVNGSVNIQALAVSFSSMPTASADAQPAILFLGTTGGGYTYGHLYEKTATLDDSTITVDINGTSIFLSGSGTSWSNTDVSPSISVFHNGTRWMMSYGFNYDGPQVADTVKPWELNGQPWTYTSGNITLYPTFADPTTYSWTDKGSILPS